MQPSFFQSCRARAVCFIVTCIVAIHSHAHPLQTSLLICIYLHFNSDSVDDWMVPLFSLVAVLWFIMAIIVQNWSFIKLLMRGRVRLRNGQCFSPRMFFLNGQRLFADDEGACVICTETMQGQEVRASSPQSSASVCKQSPHFLALRTNKIELHLHLFIAGDSSTMPSRFPF